MALTGPNGPGTLHGMKLGVAFWLNDTDWPSLREAITTADAAGFDSLWFDDHLLCDEGEASDPKLEGWTVAAAAAAITSRATIGHLVTANTFRNPGLLAKMAATLDHVSGGRAVLGIGAGWFEEEHRAFGLDFGASAGERIERMGEAVGLIRRLLGGEVVTHDGRFYQLTDAVCAPPPIQRPLPLLIGGSGPKRTLPLVARHADLWNAYGTPEVIRANGALLAEACVAIARDPATLAWTVTLNVAVRDDRASAEQAFGAVLAHNAPQQHERDLDAGGSPAEVAATLRAYADAGIGHAMWVLRPPWDLETIRRVGQVRAALGG
jgi:alkanesulfonate monooxygenase SsuD/methylene tetrahydromethanopterin reductase-like flavin-dependent oxidoreductase (luciferase family)